MPLFSIPVYRYFPHDLIYLSGDADDEVYILAGPGGQYDPVNDAMGNVILNQGGVGTLFLTPYSVFAGTGEAVCRSIESNLVVGRLGLSATSGTENRIRLTGGIIKTSGGAAMELKIQGQVTAGALPGDSATLTFTNDDPPGGIFTVDFFKETINSQIVDNGAGAVSFDVGDGVALILNSNWPNVLVNTGGGSINALARLTLKSTSFAESNEVRILSGGLGVIIVAGNLHIVSKSTLGGSDTSRTEIASSVFTTGSGKLTVEGGLVDTIAAGFVRSMVYLQSGCTVAMDEIAGVIGGIGTITGPVTVATNGYIMASRNGAIGSLSITGDLVIDGGSLVITSDGFGGLNAINCSGDFIASDVAEVRCPAVPGTFSVITAASITGTLPAPTDSVGFSHYNYNATDIEIVLT